MFPFVRGKKDKKGEKGVESQLKSSTFSVRIEIEGRILHMHRLMFCIEFLIRIKLACLLQEKVLVSNPSSPFAA